jgi:hypothetical protein
LVLALVGATLLSGCNLPPPYLGPGQDPKTATLLQEVPPTAALVLPPPGSLAVVTVLERRYANALTQTVVLANDSAVSGENTIEATFFGPVGPGAAQGDTLRWRPLDPVRISEEMIDKFPGVRMTRSPYYVQNGYGPFGYGVGRPRGGGTCLYAWQQIEPPRNKFGEPKSRGSISLRVRLCRAGATEEDLLRFMYGLVISGYFLPAAWNPYGPAPAPPAGLGGLAAPSLPVPVGENPYYAPRAREPRELRVLPAAPAAAAPVRRAAPAEAEVSPYLTPVTRPAAAQPLDQPLQAPGALPPAAAPSGSGIPAPAVGTGSGLSGTGPASPPASAPASGGGGLPRPATIPSSLPAGGGATVPPPISSATTSSQSMTVTRPQPSAPPDVRVVAPGAPTTAAPPAGSSAPAVVPPPPQ